ncbi:signaling threshold-regulating transmembrane adapter 1-like isoform X2 [Salarias fasciatus]|uniref:signaling threshold-regulating transmembrane adapter 1-like isoform X2 n=1 Tax=Salarias fasciatus TaxID=181472 RepID=UPI0011766E06|nr:signaling threshold-regulating transmembrane adapter 1-like isoform X2 [Salarias fasciatus]
MCCCNETSAWHPDCEETKVTIGLSVLLFLSLILHICFTIKYCTGKGTCCQRKRKQDEATSSSPRSSRQMEENPIYGNLSYTQTEVVFTEADPPHSSLSSQSLRDQHRVKSAAQPKNQDCYANLNLKAPRAQAGRSSPLIPQIQYSDVVQMDEAGEKEDEDEDVTGNVSPVSELYASVQTQRTKTIDMADGGEDYANHL